MATVRICDKCGEPITPKTSVTYVGLWRNRHDLYDTEVELCVSCAMKLEKWLKGEKDEE